MSKLTTLTVASLFVLATPFFASAVMYVPGATLNPSCTPTDTNCGVTVSTASSLSGTTNLATTTTSKLLTANKGITLASSTPLSTTNTLYNKGGTLYWNGTKILQSLGTSLLSLNGLTATSQSFATGKGGSDFAITSTGNTHTFSIPNAGPTSRGLISTTTQTLAGEKSFTSTTTMNVLSMNTTRITGLALPVATTDATNKAYVDALAQGVSWKSPVIALSTAAAPTTPTTGDRYVLESGATSFGTCTTNQIAQWSGSVWTCSTPSSGWSVYVNTLSTSYNYNGTAWVSLGSTINHNNLLGLQGGATGQEYHLNLSDYNAVHTGSPQLLALQTTGSPSFQGLTITSSSTLPISLSVTGVTALNGNTTITGGSTVTATSTTQGLSATFASITTGVINKLTSSIANLTNATIATLTGSTANIGTATVGTLTATSSLAVAGNTTLTNASSTNQTISGYLNVAGNTALAITNISKLLTANKGIALASSTPLSTTNTLYNKGNTLYWNGSAVGASTAGVTGTTGQTIVINGSGTQEATSTLFIASDGNVGIGTTTPGTKLVVTNTGDTTIRIQPASGVNNRVSNFDFWGTFNNNYPADTNARRVANIQSGFSTGAWGTEYMAFGVGSNDAGNLPTERMRITGNGNVGIGTSAPNASSILDLTSTTKGFLAPRMTSTQRDAITSPTTGLQIYNTTTNSLDVYNGTSWTVVGGGGSGTVTSVSGSGGTTGLTLSGGPIISSGTLTLGGMLAVSNGGTGTSTTSGARTALGLAIGTNVQAYNVNATLLGNTTTGTGALVRATSPTLTTPNLGTPSVLVGTNITGTASLLSIGGIAANVTTNANLTGSVTSVGNATSLGSFTSTNLATALTDETGSGPAVFSISPTFAGTITAATSTFSGNVGIGTTTPVYKLDIAGNINISDGSYYKYGGQNAFRLSKGLNTYYSNTSVGLNAGTLGVDLQTSVGYNAGSSNTGTSQVAIGSQTGQLNSGNNQVVVGNLAGYQNTGDLQVAIGQQAGLMNTGSNQTALGVGAGDTNTGNYQIALGNYSGKQNSGNNVTGLGYYAAYNNSGNDVVSIGYKAGYGNTVANQFIIKQANINSTPLIQGDFSTGNVGIGTTNPANKLDVVGSINISAGSAYKLNGVNAITASTTLSNYFFGSAGNLTMTGSSNTASGINALASNTTGGNNTANGTYALSSNSTGNQNTASGQAALYYNTTGFQNVAMGNTAGAYIADGTTANAISTNSIYLGVKTKALASGDANETVIGYNATGAGSNSVVLGNSSVIKTILNGNVGIGTTSPAFNLEVAGTDTKIAVSGSAGAAIYLNKTGTTPGWSEWQQTGDRTRLNANGAADLLTILNTGNVAIGSATAAQKLTVNGGVQVKAGLPGASNTNGTGYSFSSPGDTDGGMFSTADGTLQFLTNSNTIMTIDSSGRVGIGTASLASTFTVAGSSCFSVGAGATVTCGTAAGNIYYTAANSGNYDVAEKYRTYDTSLRAGDVITLDTKNAMSVERATSSDASFIGVVSTAPGVLLGGADANAASTTVPVALSGRVPVKVSLDNGPIAIGDRLTVSSKNPGVAVKLVGNGSYIGQALSAYIGTATSTTGTVTVLINSGLYYESSSANDTGKGTFFGRITKWLASATNGIGTITANVFKSNEVDTKRLCVGSGTSKTCITKSQLDALLSKATVSGSASSKASVNGSASSGNNTTNPIISSNITSTSTVSTSTPPTNKDTKKPVTSSTTPLTISAITQTTTQSTATIEWKTNKDSKSVIDYGTSTTYASSTQENSLSKSHKVTIDNLLSNTGYHFRIVSNSASSTATSSDSAFKTLDALVIKPSNESTTTTSTASTSKPS